MSDEIQAEIYSEMQELIPADLWDKFSSLSFAEMAEQPELIDYADKLRDAETRWFKSQA